MKILFYMLLFFTMSGTVCAQDLSIEPGKQAQGILESKNAMVDYTTGLFHYRVPLYKVKSGSFSLPVTLNYVAKGVKVDDRMGLLGYNWTLNTGGVVTRTVRGGIPDEEWDSGHLYQTIGSNPTESQIDQVNKKQIDGEADVFTASFNGQTVRFIIKKENDKIVAVPLERTNVKIEVSHHMDFISPVFDVWIITDEQGTKYTFSQKEWTTNVNREGVVGTNSLSNKSYVSSWYISKIEPIDGHPVTYSYLKNVEKFGFQPNVSSVNYYSTSTSYYWYGKKLIDYPFDYNKYSAAIQEQLRAAQENLKDYNLSTQINNSVTIFRNGAWISSPDFTTNIQIVSGNSKIIGMLHDFSRIAQASNQTLGVMNELINRFKNSSSIHIQSAVSRFMAVKRIVKDCLTERTEINRKELYTTNTLSVKTPVLSCIQYSNKFLFFEYKPSGGQNNSIEHVLQKIRYADQSKRIINSIDIGFNRISRRDTNNVEYDYVAFDLYDYVDCPGSNSVDVWGYPNNQVDMPMAPNSDCARLNSLKRIKTSGGGKIELEYENNSISYFYSYPQYPEGKFGGIRIKSIVVDGNDTIRYKYPEKGISIYQFNNAEETVVYPNFSDRISHNRIVNRGNVYFDSGNNGLYYRYVQEEFVGKGTKAYQFYVVDGIALEHSFSFWLYGLPLGVATYDVNNKLVNLSKYSYEYDTNLPAGVGYSSLLPQIGANPYYINKERLEEEYRRQGNVLLYSDDGYSHYLNVFNEIYAPNIQPRTNAAPSLKQAYTLSYGGKVLLKEQNDYKFENSVSQIPSISDFSIDNTIKPINTIKYRYDNLTRSVYPTRIIRVNSAGDEFVETVKRATEMSDNSDTMIPIIKNKNMYMNIISSSQLYKPYNGSQYRLLEDKVFKYANKIIEDKESIVLEKVFSNKPADLWNVSDVFTNSPLFLRPQSEYIQTAEFGYTRQPCFVTQTKEIPGMKSANYDFITGDKIFSCDNYGYDAVASADFITGYRNKLFTPLYFWFYKDLRKFYDMYITLNFDKCEKSFKDYLESEEYLKLMHIIKSLVTGENFLEWSEFELFSRQTPQIVNNFWGSHMSQLDFISPAGTLTRSELDEMRNILYNRLFMLRKAEYENMYIVKIPHVLSDKIMPVTQIQPGKNYRLYVVSEGKGYGQFSFDYKIDAQSKSVYIPGTAYTKLSVFDIDLSGYSNVAEISFGLPYDKFIYYAAIVPADAEFEATSYNRDGSVFCKFNQTGQMERYEYDLAGRPVKVFDQNGNLLKEMKYNKTLN